MKKIAANLKRNYLSVNLESSKKYYWKVVTRDEKGKTTSSDIWSFITKGIVVKILNPRDGEETTNERVSVNGKVEDFSGEIHLVVNGKEVIKVLTDRYGNFKSTVPLNLGRNIIELQIGDTSKKLLVHRTLPSINIAFGSEGRDIVFDAVKMKH